MNVWIVIFAVVIAVILLLFVLRGGSKEEKSDFSFADGADNSEVSESLRHAIKNADSSNGASLFSNVKVKGWTKHFALIHYLIIAPSRIVVIRKLPLNAESVSVKNGQWFVKENGKEKKIKNPVNMNLYAINVLRSILKKKCANFYDKLNFASVILLGDKTELNVSKEERYGAIIMKQNKIEDLVEMELSSAPVIPPEGLQCISNAVGLNA